MFVVFFIFLRNFGGFIWGFLGFIFLLFVAAFIAGCSIGVAGGRWQVAGWQSAVHFFQ